MKDNEHINVWLPGKIFTKIKKALEEKNSKNSQDNTKLSDTENIKQDIKDLNEKLNLILHALKVHE